MMRLLTLALLMIVAGCASFSFTEQQWQDAVRKQIDHWQLTETHRIRAGKLRSFSTLGEKFLIIRAGANRPYLLELANLCHELEWAQNIVTGDNLSANFDSIYFGKNPPMGCRIDKIYKLTREQDVALQHLEEEVGQQIAEQQQQAVD